MYLPNIGINSNDQEHWMVDLEALGTSPDSIILSIGACSFCLEGTDPMVFYKEPDPDRQPMRSKSLDTIQWWLNQEICRSQGTELLSDVLVEFFSMLHNHSHAQGRELVVWSNGTDFDISILNHAAESFRLQVPWQYNNVRDFRTLRKLFPEITHEFVGTKHDALCDALNEMRHCVKILTHMNALKEAQKA